MYCVFCKKAISNKGSLKAHEKYCSQNPNKEQRVSNFIKYNERVKSGETTKKYSNHYVKAMLLGAPKPEISEDTRKKLSSNSKGRKYSDEQRLKHSSIMKATVLKYPDSYTKANVVGRVKNISYNGAMLKGSWEVIVAKWLDSKGIRWEHETRWFEYEWNGKRRYYPDFYLPDYDLFIEVKGFETARDRCKWAAVPNLLVIKKDEINKIKQGCYNGLV